MPMFYNYSGTDIFYFLVRSIYDSKLLVQQMLTYSNFKTETYTNIFCCNSTASRYQVVILQVKGTALMFLIYNIVYV